MALCTKLSVSFFICCFFFYYCIVIIFIDIFAIAIFVITIFVIAIFVITIFFLYLLSLFLLITANFATRQSIAMNIDIISSKNAENLSFFKTAALLIYSAVLKYLHLLFYKSFNFFFAFMRKKVN